MMFSNNLIAVVVCGGKILREIDNTVTLPFGSEYSLRIKNKSFQRALVKIEIDGENVSQGGIIVPAGADVNLEGFMNDKLGVTGKFRFIQKTKQIADHRGDRIDDGIITVTWQFEAQDTSWKYTYEQPIKLPDSWFDKYMKRSVSVDMMNMPLGGHGTMESMCSVPLKNEGITVPGSDSSQKFVASSIGPLESTIYSMSIKLVGQTEEAKPVTAPLTVKTKLTCPTCGNSNKSNNKFCGNCGTRLLV